MKDNYFDLNEVFFSIDGEGSTSGRLAIFVRLNACNLRCHYCDTTYALEASNQTTSLENLIKEIQKYPCKNITITGGEPLCHENLIDFITALPDYHFNIETNGSLPIEPYLIDNVMITMDIKTPSSGQVPMNNYENLKLLRPNDGLKFVVASDEDLDFSFATIDKFAPKSTIFLSPIFDQTNSAHIVDRMKEYGNDQIRLQLQIHKYIWNPDQRGV